MVEKANILSQIKDYYRESERAYQNWGRDEGRDGVYALHGGFAIEGQNLSHYEEVKELSRQLIKFGQIPPNSTVLDAGCGAGALTFELVDRHKDIRVFGINVAHNQLVSADTYWASKPVDRVYFCEQDYHHLAFPDGIFDVVIFCESYIHSWDKKGLAQEIFRVVKPGGKIVLSDTFIKKLPSNEQESGILNDLMVGWYLPGILKIQEQESILKTVGFQDVLYREHTQNIIASSKRMREHTEQRVKEGNKGSEVIQLSRKAVIACNEAFKRGLTGYYFIKGYKPL